jgi:hypothetical protein
VAVTGEQRGPVVTGGAKGKVLGVWRPRGLHGKGRLGAPAAGKAQRGSSCDGCGARVATVPGVRRPWGRHGKGRRGSSCGGRGTSGGARAAWNLHATAALGFDHARGLGGKRKGAWSVGREIAVQH